MLKANIVVHSQYNISLKLLSFFMGVCQSQCLQKKPHKVMQYLPHVLKKGVQCCDAGFCGIIWHHTANRQKDRQKDGWNKYTGGALLICFNIDVMKYVCCSLTVSHHNVSYSKKKITFIETKIHRGLLQPGYEIMKKTKQPSVHHCMVKYSISRHFN